MDWTLSMDEFTRRRDLGSSSTISVAKDGLSLSRIGRLCIAVWGGGVRELGKEVGGGRWG
jgi:hypothetical protein